jgi:hypothetical protein
VIRELDPDHTVALAVCGLVEGDAVHPGCQSAVQDDVINALIKLVCPTADQLILDDGVEDHLEPTELFAVDAATIWTAGDASAIRKEGPGEALAITANLIP